MNRNYWMLGLLLLMACNKPTLEPVKPPAEPPPNPVQPVLAPAAPIGFISSALTPTSLTLNWEAVANAEAYSLERGLGDSPPSWTAQALSSPTATAYSDTQLTPNTRYSYRLRASNSAGPGDWVGLSLTTPNLPSAPNVPGNFASRNLTSSSVELIWTAVETATRYALERGFGSTPSTWTALTLAPNATSFTDPNLDPQSTYSYRLRASNALGDSPWDELRITTPTAPVMAWRVENWLSGLNDGRGNSDVVWSMRFTPDNSRILYTPRDRTVIEVRSIDFASKEVSTILGIASVRDENFAGILGMTLDPNFASNNHIYICYSLFIDNTRRNRISRFTLGAILSNEVPLLNLAGGFTQNGCRVIFDAEGKLYASMGYTGNFSIAQNINELGGKILRINPDGSIPADNPYGNAVWTFGHRNPQGIAFRPGTTQLWSTEHGENTRDELNQIIRGRNYGWPLCAGIQAYGVRMIVPNEPEAIQDFLCTGPNLTAANYQPAVREYEGGNGSPIAPSNLIFYTGNRFLGWRNNLFFVTLRTGRLYRLVLNGDQVATQEILINNTYGRLRDILQGPDGLIYFSTDTGSIYRIVPN